MRLAHCTLALALAIATACSSPAACEMKEDFSPAILVQSEALTGSLLLTQANDVRTLNFRATLSDVPDLSLLNDAVLPFTLGLRYESEPFGGDRNTEMPRLSIAASSPSSTTPIITDRYPDAKALQSAFALFKDCTLGSRPCESTLTVDIERLDGAPYPPVEVSWDARVEASVALCRTQHGDPHVALEVDSP